MPPQLRSRASPSSPRDEMQSSTYHKTYGITSSSSFDDFENLSSQSLHNVLHPQTSPSKILTRQQEQSKFIPTMKRRILTVAAVGGILTKVKVSTLFVAGTIFAVGTIHRLHIFALHSMPAEVSVQGTRYGRWGRNAPQTSRSMSRLRRHPRVVNAAVIQEVMHDAKTKFRGKQIDGLVLDPEGWISPPISNFETADDKDVDNGVDEGEKMDEEPQCVPMAQWQTTSYPNCNSVHEIDLVRSSGPGSFAFPNYRREENRRSITSHPQILHEYLHDLHLKYPMKRRRNAKANAEGLMREESIEFLGQGWFRSAWEMYVEQIPEYDEEEEEWGFEESVVLKTLRIERDFLPEYYELHRRDALAMERLTFSPYVLDIYGYCGQSAINELANFGIEGMSSLEKIARSFRGMEGIEPVSKIKLQLASMVAAGVSHVHSIDYPDFPFPVTDDSDDSDGDDNEKKSLLKDIDGGKVKVTSNATLVHYDLNPRNIAVVKRGKPKLNDFNVAEFMTWDSKNNRTCGFTGRFREPWWRAPEEMHFHMPNYTNPAPLTEKIDIYSLGNILMEILTTHSPWGLMQKGEAEEETRPKVARGELPDWPDDFNQTMLIKDPALMAINKAMRKCLKFNPEDRPTAGEIATELFEAIENLPEGFGDKEKWRREREMEDKILEERREMEADGEGVTGSLSKIHDRRSGKEHHRWS